MQTNRANDIRARVFISCGQAKGSAEESTASAVAARLQEAGFDPYIAVQEQTLRGLRENIFAQLANSEYFIFIDFKREPLIGTDPQVCRGSLFTHQELAIASYLDMPLLAFQESGVKDDDGILRFLQANAIKFADRHLVPNVIADEVRRRSWSPTWRNELVLEREPGQFSDATGRDPSQPNRLARFFHIDVRNRHRFKTARNCYVYLVKAMDLDTSTEVQLRAAEFKWAGHVWPNAHIPPGTVRRFDAVFLFHDLPTVPQFNIYTDASDYVPRVGTAVRLQFDYSVVSDDFPIANGSFILNLGKSVNLTTLKSKPDLP